MSTDNWIPGPPSEPGHYWIATMQPVGYQKQNREMIPPGHYRVRMAEFELITYLPTGQLVLTYTAEDSTWEDKRNFSAVHQHIPVPKPQLPKPV
jgi:protocatechuate 3,4-dioxygenase beta subunit